MGIDGYQPWLRRTFKDRFANSLEDLLATSRKKTVRRLFIDFNAVIHNIINEVYSSDDEDVKQDMYDNPDKYWFGEDGVFESIAQFLRMIVELIKPINLLYIGSDGVVMKAKLMQQRQRSYADLYTSEQPFDRAQIKPGTEFMMAASSYIKRRIREMVNADKINWPASVEFSDESIPGEGEHKIIARMIKKPEKQTRNFLNSVDVVYSPDSDMSLLTMMHAGGGDTIIVIRERHYWLRDLRLADGNVDAVKIPRWQLYNSTAIKGDLRHWKGIYDVKDFVLLTIFAGNDFLPNLPSMRDRKYKYKKGKNEYTENVFDGLIEVYRSVFGNNEKPNLINGDQIVWSNLILFLEIFEIKSTRYLNAMFRKQRLLNFEEKGRLWEALDNSSGIAVKGDKNNFEEVGIVQPRIFAEWYGRFVSGVWSPKVNMFEMNFDIVPEMCKAYLGGIRWVMSYYQSQEQNVNVDWSYTFHYAPSSSQLVKYMSSNIKRASEWEIEPLLPNKDLLTPVEHLLTIYPETKLYLVPKVAKNLFTNYMVDLYPKDVEIDMAYVEPDEEQSRELSKAVILLNFPSLARIAELFDEIREEPNIQARNKKQRLFSKRNNKF